MQTGNIVPNVGSANLVVKARAFLQQRNPMALKASRTGSDILRAYQDELLRQNQADLSMLGDGIPASFADLR